MHLLPIPSLPLLSPGQLCVTATLFVASWPIAKVFENLIWWLSTVPTPKGHGPERPRKFFLHLPRAILPCDLPDTTFRVAMCDDEVAAVRRGRRWNLLTRALSCEQGRKQLVSAKDTSSTVSTRSANSYLDHNHVYGKYWQPPKNFVLINVRERCDRGTSFDLAEYVRYEKSADSSTNAFPPLSPLLIG
jgi:hypothetical protein